MNGCAICVVCHQFLYNCYVLAVTAKALVVRPKSLMIAGKRAQLWATFNEPEVASLCGHVMGNHPPGNLLQFKAAGNKLCTMLRAHAAAYKAIKQMPGKQ